MRGGNGSVRYRPAVTAVAWSGGVSAVALYTVVAVLAFQLSSGPAAGPSAALWPVPFVAMAVVGALVASRRSDNATGWLFLSAGLLMVGNAFAHSYSRYSLARPNGLPATHFVAWLAFWTWIPAIMLIAVVLVLFPTGRSRTRFWRWVVRADVVLLGIICVAALPTLRASTSAFLDATTPSAVPGGGWLDIFDTGAAPPMVLLGFVALVVRFVRSRGVERMQMKWFVFGASLLALAVLVVPFLPGEDPISHPLGAASAFIGMMAIPVTAGIAILKHRLYDIDVVISKTVVYGALAGFITSIYVGVVVGIGALVGASDKPNLGLSLAATAIVAVAFQPVRERVQRFANKLVYGERVTPYEAITGFSHRMAESLSLDSVLPQMAEAAARGVAGVRSRVKLLLPAGAEQVVTWPDGSSEDSFDRTLAVVHQGEEMGEIAVSKAPGEQINSGEEKLLADLASQAGLAMRNLRLTAELQQRLVELQASRQRIVKAQDEERRRMERDIHDGAQQQLVSMSVKLGLLNNLLSRDAEKAGAMLEELRSEASEAVETLRDLARGLFPEILTEQGLCSALESHVTKMGLDATVEGEIGRFDLEIEANVYFCIREALQNASKHAPGSPIVISFAYDDDQLFFSVRDEGPGFDPKKVKFGSGLQNMADRVEALGGVFQIASSSRKETSVTGRLPATRRAGSRI